MVKINCSRILGLIGSLSVVCNSLAAEINIQFGQQGSFYKSPVVYLTGVDGQIPKVAMKKGIPTTGGVDGQEDKFSEFTSVPFQIIPKIDGIKLKIIPILSEEGTFVNN